MRAISMDEVEVAAVVGRTVCRLLQRPAAGKRPLSASRCARLGNIMY